METKHAKLIKYLQAIIRHVNEAMIGKQNMKTSFNGRVKYFSGRILAHHQETPSGICRCGNSLSTVKWKVQN